MQIYDKDYFENGPETGKSLYTNYRWIPETTIPIAHHIVSYLGLKPQERLLDFGCSKGYNVKAMRLLGIDAYGVDISDYAISQVDNETRPFCRLVKNFDYPFGFEFNSIVSKDVLEHLTETEIRSFLENYGGKCEQMLHIMPLGDNGSYRLSEAHLDPTHIQAQNEEWWTNLFNDEGFHVKEVRHTIYGVKDNWLAKHSRGIGFFLIHKK